MLYAPTTASQVDPGCGCLLFFILSSVITIVYLALVGPAVGNVFSNIVAAL